MTVIILKLRLLSLNQHNPLSIGFWVIEGLRSSSLATSALSLIAISPSQSGDYHALNVDVPVGVASVSRSLELCQNSFSMATVCTGMLVMWVCGFSGGACDKLVSD